MMKPSVKGCHVDLDMAVGALRGPRKAQKRGNRVGVSLEEKEIYLDAVVK